jgi:protein AATF/BFR2
VHLHACPARVKSRDLSRPSTLRRHLDSVIDPKYVGIKASRKQLEEDNSLGTFVDSPEEGESASQFISSEGSVTEEDEGEEKVQSPGEKEEASEGEQSTPRNNQGIQENPSL